MKSFPIKVLILFISIGMVGVGYAQKEAVAEMHQRGIASYQRGNFPVCIDLWKQAREIAHKAKLEQVEVAILVNMAMAYQSMGNPALAFHTLDEAEQLAGKLNDSYLQVQIRGVRAGVGNDDRSLADPPRQGDASSELAWAQAQLDGLLQKLRPPEFPAPPTLEEWSAANEYFKARPQILRSKVDDSPSLKTRRMLQDALQLAQTRNFLDASEIIEFELGKDRKTVPYDREIRKLYASLASVLSERKKNDLAQLCQAEVDRMDASNVIDKEPEALLLSNTRQGGNWGDLFKGPAAKRLAGRDLKMMRIVARGEFFRRLKLAAAQFAMLAEEKRSAERSQGMAEGLKTLAEAAEIAEVQFRTKRALDVRRVLGAWLAVPGFGREGRKSEHHLLAAWAAAQQNGDEALEASALNDLGISFSARESNGMGIACFDRAAGIAKRSVDLELLSRILLNRARTTGDRAELERAEAQMSRLPDSHTKAQMLVSVGQLSLKQGRVKASYQNSKAALETARRSEDPLATSHALGFLGKLYHSQGRNDQALALSRRALQLAQDEPLRSRDLAFRWTWQIGRVLKAKGQLQSSLESYHRAGELLAEIRQDTVIGYRQRGPGSSFREEIGPFYVELADFAFAEARRHSSDSAEWESSLRQARESIELFKAALLEDYFHDSSITTYRQAKGLTSDALPRRSVGDVARLSTTPTAVLYFIPMESRTEILVELGGRMYWHTAEIERITLETLTKKMRLALDPMVSSGDTTHMAPSRRLYDVLIRPLENLLEEHGVETLVVVPDGKLRSIPIGVLHDGKRFLIERFSLATVPDLLLMDDSGQQVGSGRPLLAGLSESVQGFAALPGVSAEIADLGNQFQKHSSKSLLNEDFTSRSFAASFRSNFDLVHLASHANFSNDLEDTFVLTHEDRIGLSDLERSVRQLAFRERPLDLLVLSACETAVGNDRAALGLAGIAVKSGAHSVVASLWAVDDQATGALVRTFYQRFLPKQTGLSKAQALQSAQLQVMKDPAWKHPKYWAPFTVIGNWLTGEERLRIYRELDLKAVQPSGRLN